MSKSSNELSRMSVKHQGIRRLWSLLMRCWLHTTPRLSPVSLAFYFFYLFFVPFYPAILRDDWNAECDFAGYHSQRTSKGFAWSLLWNQNCPTSTKWMKEIHAEYILIGKLLTSLNSRCYFAKIHGHWWSTKLIN